MNTTETTSAMGAVRTHLIGEETSNQEQKKEATKDYTYTVSKRATVDNSIEDRIVNPKDELLNYLLVHEDTLKDAILFYRLNREQLENLTKLYNEADYNYGDNCLFDMVARENEHRMERERKEYEENQEYLKNQMIQNDTKESEPVDPYDINNIPRIIRKHQMSYTVMVPMNAHINDDDKNVKGRYFVIMDDRLKSKMTDYISAIEKYIKPDKCRGNKRDIYRRYNALAESRYIIPSDASELFKMSCSSISDMGTSDAHLATKSLGMYNLYDGTMEETIEEYRNNGYIIYTFYEFACSVREYADRAVEIIQYMSWWDKHVRYRRAYKMMNGYLKIARETIL